jgi:hypothetical protein
MIGWGINNSKYYGNGINVNRVICRDGFAVFLCFENAEESRRSGRLGGGISIPPPQKKKNTHTQQHNNTTQQPNELTYQKT